MSIKFKIIIKQGVCDNMRCAVCESTRVVVEKNKIQILKVFYFLLTYVIILLVKRNS